jgi:putative phage-type endonuclease
MSLKFNYHKDLPKVNEFKKEYLKNQVILLKNIFQPEQKSKEWYEMRNEMLTASDWGTILGMNHYSNSNEVLKKKCGDNTFITNAAMQWGNKYESVAVLIYEHRNKVDILEFGCLRHPFIPFLGASPDGITSEGIMLEIKCPTSRQITGTPPEYYWAQVQGQLEVCDLDRCDFLECNFKEYADEKDYVDDNYYQNNLLNKYGNEKGVIIELYKKNEKSFFYDYSPVCIMNQELEDWKKNIIKKYDSENIIVSCFSYWYLEEVSCVPIYRNQEWFYNAKFELELFWNKVLKYRELGINKLLEDIDKDKIEKKIIKNNKKEEKSNAKKSKDLTQKKQRKMKEFIVIENNSSSEEVSDEEVSFTTSMFSEETNNNEITKLSLFSEEFVSNTKLSLFSN